MIPRLTHGKCSRKSCKRSYPLRKNDSGFCLICDAVVKAGVPEKRDRGRSTRAESGGRSFMSKGERDCFEYLAMLERLSLIRDLECQVSVELTEARLRWVLDFRFFDTKIGEPIFADFKGLKTERWMMLEKLWPFYGPYRLWIFEKNRQGGMTLTKEIKGK